MNQDTRIRDSKIKILYQNVSKGACYESIYWIETYILCSSYIFKTGFTSEENCSFDTKTSNIMMALVGFLSTVVLEMH